MKRLKLSGRSIDIIICFIFLFLALTIFRDAWQGNFSKTDLDLPFNPVDIIQTRTFAWVDKIYFGNSGSEYEIPHIWPTFISYYVLNVFGLSAGMIECLIYVLMFTVLGCGMYFFMSSVALSNFNNISGRKLVSFVAATFYMFNPYTFFSLEVQHYDFLMVLAFFPVFLTFLMLGKEAYMKSDKKYFEYIVLLGITSTILLPANYAITYTLIFFFIWFLVFESAATIHTIGSQAFKKLIKYSICCLIVILLLNLWWILNFAWTFFDKSGFTYTLSTRDAFNNLTAASNIGLVDALRLQPTLFRTTIYPRFPFNPEWDVAFTSPFMTILGVSISVFAFVCLISKEGRNKYTFFWAVTFISFFPIYLGLSGPFGQIFLWLWNNVPLFHIFRNPDKFMTIIVFSLTVILGSSISLLYRKIQNMKLITNHNFRRIFSLVVFVILLSSIFINSYPLLSGNFGGELAPINPPKYYEESKQWLNAQETQEGSYRVMIIPFDSLLESYGWGPNYDTLSVPYKIYNQPIVYYDPQEKAAGLPSGTLNVAEFFPKYFESGGQSVAELLSLMNVKYVLVRDDLIQRLPQYEYRDGQWYEIGQRGAANTTIYKSILDTQTYIRKVAEFGNLTFYENEINNPLIYPAKNLVYSNESVDNTLSNLLSLPGFSFSNLTIVSGQFPIDGLPSETLGSLVNGEQVSDDQWKMEILDSGNYTLYSKEVGIDENWFSLMGTQNDWEQYVDGGSFGILTATNNSISLSSNENWYIYSRDVNFSLNDLRFLNIRYRSTGTWYIWLDWIDSEGGGHRASIRFGQSDTTSLQTIDLLTYLTKASGSIPQTIHQIELNPDPFSNVYIDSIKVSKDAPSLTKLGVENLSQGTNYINSDAGLTDLVAIKTVEANPPSIQFEKKSPVEYVVKVSNATEPFVLVLSETFSSGWKAHFSDAIWLQTLFANAISDQYHFVVNSYANAWYINKTGTYTITLEFWPQNLLYAGASISITTFILCAMYVSRDEIRFIYKKYAKKNNNSALSR